MLTVVELEHRPMQPRTFVSVAVVVVFIAACAKGMSGGLASELVEMGRRDQDARERLMELVREAGQSALETEAFEVLAAEQAAIDEANFVRLDEIVSERGWPTVEQVGERANGAAWLILEHADIERQRRYLDMMRRIVAEGRASGAKLANLEDEIALADNGLQVYGTEIKMDLLGGGVAVAPVADPENLDERRASIGLPPMEEYLRRAEAELGVPVDRSALAPGR